MWTFWIYFSIGLVVLALGVVIAFIVRKRATKLRVPVPQPPCVVPRAKLILPGNIEISLANGVRSIGRGDLARAVSANDLGYISHQHFAVGFENGQYNIDDLNSTNGTRLNGVEIKGKGKHILKDSDQIKVAEVITLIFKGV